MISLSFWRRAALTAFFVASSSLIGCAQDVQKVPVGAEIQIGGLGRAPGQFADLRDMTFDARGQLVTLEGPLTRTDAAAPVEGGQRVQIFSRDGDFLSQFPLDTADSPAHLAVDGRGGIYVSFPTQNRVTLYQNGRKTRDFSIEGATGLTHYRRGGQTLVAAIGGTRDRKNEPGVGGDRIVLLDANAGAPISVPLSQKMDGVSDFAADGDGNFYVLAAVNSIYVFDAGGKLRKTIGTGTALRADDGSEVRSSLAVSPDGTVYSLTGKYLVKFEARSSAVTRREGLFQWYDGWNSQILALDNAGQLWAASTTLQLGKNSNLSRFHFRPAILRLTPDFFASQAKGTLKSSREGAGVTPTIASAAPDGVAFDLSPFRVDVNFPAATRTLSHLDGVYRVYDALKTEVAQGRFPVDLRDGQAFQTSFSFVPPRFGAYTADISLQNGGREIVRSGALFGVTPPYSNLPRLENSVNVDRRADAPRQMFSGLPALRLSVGAGVLTNPRALDNLETSFETAQRAGANVWLQFTEARDADPEVVRAVVERFKGRVKTYEIINEPNLDMNASRYLALLRPASETIHRLDPGAQVMGPACVSINLKWYQAFFEGGGASLVDIVSFHDYEGNESIEPSHWRAKIGALRALMAQFGAADKPLWQTERAIPAVRANIFSPLQQAIRIAVHDDVLQEMGIPIEHNFYFYLNESGYSKVPSYLWSSHGPHPAVFVLRTRYALTKDRRFAGILDFGRTGNTLWSGLRFSGPDSDIISLRTQGAAPLKLRFAARGSGFQIIDAWGNQNAPTSENGPLELEIGPLPIYVRVPQGASFVAPRLDLGRDLAPEAQFGYSGVTKSDFALLNDGIIGTIHGGLPQSSTRGATVWRGELPDPGFANDDSTLQNPPALSMTFPQARPVAAFVVRALAPDNAFSALLDFNIEARRGANWQVVAAVRSSQPASEMLALDPTAAFSWADDTHNFLVRLPQTVTAREWRLVPRRASFGLAADALALRARQQILNKPLVPALWLSEIEIYGEK